MAAYGKHRQIYLKKIALRRRRLMDRKEDTRKKIQLGGLIVKAGLDHMHPHGLEKLTP